MRYFCRTLLLAALAAIGTAAWKPAQAASAAGGTLDQLAKDGRLVIGMGQDAPPFGYRQNGELVGYDVDIAKAVAKRLQTYIGHEVTVEFKAVTDETRISWVKTGEVQMSLAHTNITRKRLENIDFSVPYGWDGKGVLYGNAAGKLDLHDFSGKTVGFKRSSSSEGEIKAYFAEKGWEPPVLKQFDNHAAGIQAVVDGQIDGFTDDNSIVINTAVRAGHKVSPDGPLTVTTTPYSPTYFGIGLPQNDSAWRRTVDYALHDLWTSGEFQQIYQKWFGPDSNCPIPLADHKMEAFVKG